MEEFVFDYNKYDGKKAHANKEQVAKIIIDLQRRKELETRALNIVKFLMEGQLRPETFLRCLKHINQTYYDDVVEERYLSKLCGYPLCNKPLTVIYKQQFRIDPKNKKVYDVTNLQKFCSAFCYSASNHIREQMNDEWDMEVDKTKLSLLSPNNSISHGEETNLSLKKTSENLNFVSVSSFTQMSLSEIDDPDIETKRNSSKAVGKTKIVKVMDTLKESNEDEVMVHDNIKPNFEKQNVLIDNETDSMELSCSTSGEENNPRVTDQVKNIPSEETKKDKDNEIENLVPSKNIPSNNSTTSSKYVKKTKSKAKVTKQEKLGDILSTIKKSIFEWVTIETYRFLYGKEKIQSVLNTEQLNKQFQSLNLETTSDDIKEKYSEVISKLKLSELKDEHFDKSVFGKTLLKPTPNYEQLQAETEYKMLKIRAWCGGTFYNVKEKEESENINCELKVGDVEEECGIRNTTSVQKARRKIYIKSISPAITKLAENLSLPTNVILEELTLLVETFNLDAHNILFKPAVWTMLSLVLIKILSIKNQQIRTQLEIPQAKAYIQIIYNYIPNAKTQIQELLENVADFNLFLKNYLSTNEVTEKVAVLES